MCALNLLAHIWVLSCACVYVYVCVCDCVCVCVQLCFQEQFNHVSRGRKQPIQSCTNEDTGHALAKSVCDDKSTHLQLCVMLNSA